MESASGGWQHRLLVRDGAAGEKGHGRPEEHRELHPDAAPEAGPWEHQTLRMPPEGRNKGSSAQDVDHVGSLVRAHAGGDGDLGGQVRRLLAEMEPRVKRQTASNTSAANNCHAASEIGPATRHIAEDAARDRQQRSEGPTMTARSEARCERMPETKREAKRGTTSKRSAVK